MNHLSIALVCIAGFAALAAATERQQERILGRPLPAGAGRLLRLAGGAILVAGLWLAVRTWGWGFGLVAYSGHTSLAAGLVFLALLLLPSDPARR